MRKDQIDDHPFVKHHLSALNGATSAAVDLDGLVVKKIIIEDGVVAKVQLRYRISEDGLIDLSSQSECLLEVLKLDNLILGILKLDLTMAYRFISNQEKI